MLLYFCIFSLCAHVYCFCCCFFFVHENKFKKHTGYFKLVFKNTKFSKSLVKAKWFSLCLNNELSVSLKNPLDPRTKPLIYLNKNF